MEDVRNELNSADRMRFFYLVCKLIEMKFRFSLLLPALFLFFQAHAQNIGINTSTPHASAELDITNDRSNLVAIGDSALFNNGIGVTLDQHATGNTAIGSKVLYSNTTGYGNTAAGYMSLYFSTNAFFNTANGYQALYSNTTGVRNTASGAAALYSNTTGGLNTASGNLALYRNVSGTGNSAHGNGALYRNTTGDRNTANGDAALYSNSTGDYNTANGYLALYENTSGYSNVAIGVRALYLNTDRSNLVAIGDSALFNNGEGALQSFHAVSNTAVGSKALYANTIGHNNTANGYRALFSNTTGNFNTAIGYQSLLANTLGGTNTATGHQALFSNTDGYDNTANGSEALNSNTTGYKNNGYGNFALSGNTTGHHNTGLGYNAETGSNLFYATAIGAGAITGCSNCLVLGGPDATSRTRVGINITMPVTDLQIRQQSDAAGNTSRGIRLQRSTNLFWRVYVDGGSALTFEYTDGGAGNWGWINTIGSFVDGSDARSKKNIQPAENVLDKLARLQPRKYSRSFLNLCMNEGGMLGITYGSFGVIAVKAIQEQQVQIDKLTKENDALSTKNKEATAAIGQLQAQLQNMMGLITALNEKVSELAVK